MSLQLAAQHLSDQGRGPDDRLVHMSTKELKSLNDLARAHGGQLTINPHTGLPEAGVLDSLLPTIIGAGISYFSGGAISPGMIGLGLGGFEAVRTGSLEKGVLAGLGAYGGAGLTEGLMGAGAAAIGKDAAATAVKEAPTFADSEAGRLARSEYYNTAVADKMAAASNFDKLSAGFTNPGMAMDAMGGGWQTAKYAAGAAAPYLADAYKPTTDMPLQQKPVEYRQYKVRRRPDLSYEYTPLPVSNTYTPNLAEGGGISELVGQYVDPSFRLKDVSGPPKIKTATSMPELKLAKGGRITPEEFYDLYMKKDPAATPELKYGARGYADDVSTTPVKENPYERVKPKPADIVGVDGITYTWDEKLFKYVPKPGVTPPSVVSPTTDTTTDSSSGRGGVNPDQARIDKFFNDLEASGELPAYQQKQADFINMLMPFSSATQFTKNLKNKFLYKSEGEEQAPVENRDTMSEDAVNQALGGVKKVDAFTPEDAAPVIKAFQEAEQNQQNNPLTKESFMHDSVVDTSNENPFSETFVTPTPTPEAPAPAPEAPAPAPGGEAPGGAPAGGAPAGGGAVSSGGVSASSGSPMGGIASSGTSGQAAAAVGAANAAAASGATSGGVSASSGSPMAGIASSGGGEGGSAGAGGGGGGGGGGGCCFIMLEARYGNGTMDNVIRKYRDEMSTERNKRGYYKLAEVFVPLMREYWIFRVLVVLLFADPAVAYAKWYYGQNKWGWIFTPLKKFWMRLFDVLGGETKFIRENGEVV